MDHFDIKSGSKAELVAELTSFGKGRLAQNREDRAHVYARALALIEDGATEVRIGSHVWVIEDSPFAVELAALPDTVALHPAG